MALRTLPADDIDVVMEAPRLAGLFRIVGDEASAGQALGLVKTTDGSTLNVLVHSGLAEHHARSGNVAAAREQVDLARKAEVIQKDMLMGDVMELISALQPWPAAVAQAHVDAGHPEEALRLVELFKDHDVYAASLRSIVVLAKAFAGDVPGVKRELEHLEPGMLSREFVRGYAVQALARKADEKRLRDMAAWFESIPDAQQRISSYLAVAETLLE